MFYESLLFFCWLFTVGHTLGFRQSDPKWGVDALLAQCGPIHFDVQGFDRTYWTLSGGRILCRRVLCIRGDIGMAAGGLPQRLWRSCAALRGVRLALGHHGCELENISLSCHRFLNRDYIV